MRLYYHPGIISILLDTPWDYEPPMFQPGPDVALPKCGNELNIGKVGTGFHEISLMVLTESKAASVVDEKLTEQVMSQSQRLVESHNVKEKKIESITEKVIIPSPTLPKKSEKVLLRTDSTQSDILFQTELAPAFADVAPLINTTIPKTPPVDKMPELEVVAPVQSKKRKAEAQEIACVCQGSSDLGEFVQCEDCSLWCHLVCFGYKSINDPALPVKFSCHKCSSSLIPLKELYDLAMKRKVLVCAKSGFKSFRALWNSIEMDLNHTTRLNYKAWMESLGCVTPLPKRKFDVVVDETLLNQFLDPKLNYVKPAKEGKQKVSVIKEDMVVMI